METTDHPIWRIRHATPSIDHPRSWACSFLSLKLPNTPASTLSYSKWFIMPGSWDTMCIFQDSLMTTRNQKAIRGKHKNKFFCDRVVSKMTSLLKPLMDAVFQAKKVAGGIFHTLIYWPGALQPPQHLHLTEIKENFKAKGNTRLELFPVWARTAVIKRKLPPRKHNK